MAESHVVSALKAKRAEVAGEMEAARQRMEQLRADLGHLDATLRIFDPDLDPGHIAPKRPLPAGDGLFERGEVPRLCLDILRRAGRGLDSRAVAEGLARLRGMDPADRKLMDILAAKAGKTLCALRGRGLVESTPRDGILVWAIAA